MYKMYRKGTEEDFSIWWFVIVALAGVGITISVLTFYSAELDVREYEAGLISDSISECLINNGELIEDSLSGNFDIYETCSLSREIFDMDELYFSVSFFSEDREIRENILGGDNSFVTECEIVKNDEGERIEAENVPVCFEKNFKTYGLVNGERVRVDVKILSASNQRGGKVPVI